MNPLILIGVGCARPTRSRIININLYHPRTTRARAEWKPVRNPTSFASASVLRNRLIANLFICKFVVTVQFVLPFERLPSEFWRSKIMFSTRAPEPRIIHRRCPCTGNTMSSVVFQSPLDYPSRLSRRPT